MLARMWSCDFKSTNGSRGLEPFVNFIKEVL